ncbi:DUF6792 domain-containing protein [Shouchella patagoniensis]|uniref:DUF6792 domain-containing protein n=1 Tax=Shouchella patagoniensis TaxID=228576 RepID=UPI000994E338|nr:DUF6792 domain-containing protein [Shouchella patagoniensis]
MSQILENKMVQMRITNLEYKFDDMTEKEVVHSIQRIYLEETGKPLEVNIEIERMDTYSQQFTSDAKGTAIILDSEGDEGEIKEIVFISRGSETNNDWIDNVFGIGVGTGGAQYARDSTTFIDIVNEKNKTADNVPIYSLAHSKGHNTVATIQLRDEYFSEVNTFNGAQSNTIQQIIYDEDFRFEVRRKFNVSDLDSIRSIPPEELEAFAKDYYEDKGTNIHQTRSTSDFLYALDAMPGMFVVGNVQEHQTDHVNDGFVGAMDAISKEDLQLISHFLAPYGEVYAEDGVDGLLQSALDEAYQFYVNNPEADPIDFDSVRDSMGGLVKGLRDAGYLSEEDAEDLRTELIRLVDDVEPIYESMYEGEGFHPQRMWEDFVHSFMTYNFSTKQRMEKIDELFAVVGEAAYDHHSLEALMNELAVGKSYQGGEMYLELGGGPGGQGQIKLNLSKTLDAYAAITRCWMSKMRC